MRAGEDDEGPAKRYLALLVGRVPNGTLTVDVEDDKHANGPFALQYGIFNAESPDPQAEQGMLKFRSLQIR